MIVMNPEGRRPRRVDTPESDLLRRQQDLERELHDGLRLLREPREASGEEFNDSDDVCLRVEHVWRELREVRDALATLETGQYGVCTDCGRRIPRARLRANPVAIRCRDCQSQCDGIASR